MGNRTCRTALPDGLHQYGIFGQHFRINRHNGRQHRQFCRGRSLRRYAGIYGYLYHGSHLRGTRPGRCRSCLCPCQGTGTGFFQHHCGFRSQQGQWGGKSCCGNRNPYFRRPGKCAVCGFGIRRKKRRHAGLHHWRPDRPVGHRHRPRCHSRRRPHTGTAPTGGLERCPL